MLQLMKYRYGLLMTVSISCVLCAISIQGATIEERLKDEIELDKLCSDIQHIKTLSQMELLIHSVKKVMSEISYYDYQKLATAGWDRYFKLGLHPSLQCLEQADAIVDLGPIIAERENVCHANHISKLAAYKNKYLKSEAANLKVKRREDYHPLTEEFFSIYLNQVAYICRQNLLIALQLADKQVGGQENYAKVLPWIINNNDGCILDDSVLDAAEDDFDVFGLSGYGRPAKDVRDIRCNAIKALSSIKKINELVEALEENEKQQQQVNRLVLDNGSVTASSTNQVKNEIVGEQQTLISKTDESDESETCQTNDKFILVVPEQKYNTVESMMQVCTIFEQVYMHTVMPIVQLTLLGAYPNVHNYNKAFDHQCLEEELIQRWFSITLICKPLLNSRLARKSTDTSNRGNKNGLVVVENKGCPTKSTDLISRKPSELNQIEPPAYLSYPIEDDLWIGKHNPSRLANMKSRFITKMVRTFKINKLVNSVVWRKNAKKDRKVSISLILVILTLIGIDGSIFFYQ